METNELQLTSLGNRVPLPTVVDQAILERIPNRWPKAHYEVHLTCDEFTSMCPVTAQPDFGTIYITYTPDQWIVESKSLKLYLGAFRNTGTFGEEIANRVCDDLVQVLSPKQIEVRAEFTARGGIRIKPIVRWEKG